ncbi:MAG: NUDIX domain-containing protein [Acetobacteraceae bacterium]
MRPTLHWAARRGAQCRPRCRRWGVADAPDCPSSRPTGGSRLGVSARGSNVRTPVVGIVVLKGEHVLLVRHGKPLGIGSWTLPGGGQELGEIAIAARLVASQSAFGSR